MPDIVGAALRPDQDAFEWSDNVDRPDTDQAGVFRVTAALDLHGQAQHLQEQHTHQDDQVTVAAEYGFHKKTVSKFQGFKVSTLQGWQCRRGVEQLLTTVRSLKP